MKTNRRDLFKILTVGIGGLVSNFSFAKPVCEKPPKFSTPKLGDDSRGYIFFTGDEATVVEALVDHMIPSDCYSPKGTDLGLNIYIDRALGGAWGKGDRLYMSGPWKTGSSSQGYQLPLTPAALYRSGLAELKRYCQTKYGASFEGLSGDQKEEVLKGLSEKSIEFKDGVAANVFFDIVYQTVMEGLFSDPIYGGNRNKLGWKMIGFPGVIAVHRENVVKFHGKKFTADPVSIADMS